jgi:hypothetical protein
VNNLAFGNLFDPGGSELVFLRPCAGRLEVVLVNKTTLAGRAAGGGKAVCYVAGGVDDCSLVGAGVGGALRVKVTLRPWASRGVFAEQKHSKSGGGDEDKGNDKRDTP